MKGVLSILILDSTWSHSPFPAAQGSLSGTALTDLSSALHRAFLIFCSDKHIVMNNPSARISPHTCRQKFLGVELLRPRNDMCRVMLGNTIHVPSQVLVPCSFPLVMDKLPASPHH